MKPFRGTFEFVILAAVLIIARAQECPGGIPVTYVKYSNSAPRSVIQPILLYASVPGVAITAECYNRCRKSMDCAGFIIDYPSTSCYRVPNMGSSTDNIIVSSSSNFFRKACLRVPENCNRKAWPIEVSMDYELNGFQLSVIPNVVDKWQCAQQCLDQQCKSANYYRKTKICSLNSETRRTKPAAYSPSPGQVEYLENQCVDQSSGINEMQSCWHEPVFNRTLQQVDLQVENINIEQCKDRCEAEEYFNCRGYTFKCPTNEFYGGSICLLHSDDTMTAGPLVPSLCATYVERIPCIDLSVTCSDTTMSVTLNSPAFKGRMFVLGRPEECGVNGRNMDTTTMTMPITENHNQRNPCNIVVAKSTQGNRKLATAVVVVQHHPIIQTVGDRVTRLSCAMGSDSRYSPSSSGGQRPQNITLDATFGVAEPTIHNTVYNDGGFDSNGLIGSANVVAKMRILEVGHNDRKVSEVTLGDELELRIDVNYPYNATKLRAGHLVASSGDGLDSLLLLDWRGCPPEPATFPVLEFMPPNSMVARFKAFRFPSSPILRFSIMLTFCEQDICQPNECDDGRVTLGRRRRAVSPTENKSKEVPLQLAIVVRSIEEQEQIIADQSLIKGNDSIPSNNIDRLPRNLSTTVFNSDEWCISFTSALTMIAALIAVQTLIFIVFWSCLRQSKKKAVNDRVTLNSDFQPRHVTWADSQ
ncbi:uncharacterized protein LOC126900950 [Daktulosphaira vitifoliae]|uniref:uncharacterized protein LOC126900950 n=1 Tax=Daktulosphaira vitifoliae TaxID=58002 RepID=UPI0021AA7F95|nr:uncharacterized protein LOC126900950 [Daktulosphaira vitifoliae]